MSCHRSEEIDLTAYLADPGADEFTSFRRHFPDCDDCTAALEALTAFERTVEVASGFAHPPEASLLAYAEGAGLSRAERASVAGHVSSCPECRTTLTAFAPIAAMVEAGPEQAVAPERERWLERARALWSGLFESLAPVPVLAMAGAAAVALAFFFLQQSGEGPGGEPGRRIAERPAPRSEEAPAPEPTAPPEIEMAEQGAPEALAPAPEPAPEPVTERPVEMELAQPSADEPKVAPPAPVAEETSQEWILAMADMPMPAYQDPNDPAAWMRLPGTVRSGASKVPRVQALAPAHVSHTARSSPTLFFYSDADLEGPITFVLMDEASGDASEHAIAGPLARGVQSIDLGALGLELTEGPVYVWSVIVPVPGDADEEVIAEGAIRRVERSAQIAAIASGPRAEQAAGYAAAGLWYDALAVVSEAIAADVARGRIRLQRAALLEQAGLDEAAAFDREAGPR